MSLSPSYHDRECAKKKGNRWGKGEEARKSITYQGPEASYYGKFVQVGSKARMVQSVARQADEIRFGAWSDVQSDA